MSFPNVLSLYVIWILPSTTRKNNLAYGASVSAMTIVSNNVREGAIVGPKARHFKTYGYRDLDKIKNLIRKYPNK